MKDTDFLFSSCAIKSLENSLLPHSFFDQIISMNDFGSVEKFMIEKGFSGFERSSTVEVALGDYLLNSYEELSEILQDKKSVLDFIVIKNDFHNLKAAIKMVISGKKSEGLFKSPSLFDADEIFECVKNRDFEALPLVLRECAEKAWEIVKESQNGQKLEVFVDKCSLDTAYKYAEKTGNEYCKEIQMTENTLTNLKIAYRMAMFPTNETVISEALVDHAETDNVALVNAVYHGTNDVAEYIESFSDDELCSAIKRGFASFEKACDEKLFDVVNKAHFVPFGVETGVSFYMTKQMEYRNLCKLISLKKADFPSEQIRERLTFIHE